MFIPVNWTTGIHTILASLPFRPFFQHVFHLIFRFKKVEVSCMLKKEMHVLQGHSGPVLKVTEARESHFEKNCSLSLGMCKHSNDALQGPPASKELCLQASQALNTKQLMSLSSSAKLDQNSTLDSFQKKFPALEVSPADSCGEVVSVDMRSFNPWAREYKSCKTRSNVLSENITVLENVIAHSDDVASVNMRSLNPWTREYKSCNIRNNVLSENVIAHLENPRLSYKQESMPSFFESFRKQDLSSNLTVNEPILFANMNGNSNLLNILNYFPHKAPVVCSRKKLLVLDINGILADIVYPPPKGYKADTKIAGRAVFTRPFCSDFLNFCLERFNVAIWSSRSRKIIDRLLNYLMGDMKHKLIFCWDVTHCTASSYRTLENKHKTLVFKELRKVWETFDSDLPWEKGFFNESNTFMLDDTPYKALLNPAHTGIFPYSYEFKDIGDEAIGPGGNIRAYLEEVAAADNVQRYIEKHPFGQSAITERSLSWQFYDKVIKEQSGVLAAG